MRLATRRLALLLSSTAALLAACSSTPEAPTAAPTPVAARAPAPAATPAPSATPQATTRPQMASKALPPYLDSKNPLATEGSVYFDFDDFSIKKDYEAMLSRHGSFLASNPKVAIKVEGNADERGSSEYNLALGQKRAQSVVNALKVYGVKDSQMEPVSWGEERPKALGHDEAAWAQNRRADLQYPLQ